ncbi:MAG: PAS domain S-box protein [Candidatus Dormibacteria bacterium]
MTAERRASEALADAVLNWSLVFDLAPVGMAEVAPDGRFIKVNPALCAILGYDAPGLLAAKVSDINHPDELARSEENIRTLAANEVSQLLIEKRYRHRDGHTVWASVAASPILTPEGGVDHFLAFYLDITARKATEEQLQRSLHEMQTIFDTALNALITMDEHGRVTAWSAQAERTFGWSAAEAVGLDLADRIIPPQHREAHRRGLAAYLTTGEGPVLGSVIETTALRKSGEEFPVELAISPASRGDDATSFVGFVRDISDRARSQRLERMTVAVTEVLARGRTVDEVVPGVLETVGGALGQTVGQFWVVDERRGALVHAGAWRVDPSNQGVANFVAASQLIEIGGGPGPLATAWQHGRLVSIDDLVGAPHFRRSKAAQAAGLTAEFAFPVHAGDTVAGVFEFLGDSAVKIDEVVRSAVTIVGAQVGEYMVRVRTDQRVLAILDHVADGIITVGDDGAIQSFNRAARRLLGYDEMEVLGRQVDILIEEGHRREFMDYLALRLEADQERPSSDTTETLGLREDGSSFALEFQATDMVVAGRRVFIATVRDISERKAETAALEFKALHDALTGLPNRSLFHDRLAHALVLGGRAKTELAVLMIDLDGFKATNDEFGHAVGDQLLEAFAGRVLAALRDGDTVARLGGDEFAILANPVAGERGALLVAQKVGAVLVEPFRLAGQQLQVRASIGIALFPRQARDAESLLRRADIAMYAAKRSGGGNALFRPEQEAAATAN